MSRTLSRRAMLFGGAGCLVGLPLFESLGLAQPGAAPARFVAYCQPFACLGDLFWPGSPAFDFNKGQIALYPHSGRTVLDNPSFEMTPILKPLEPYKNELIVVEGLENANGNHDAYSAMLTGWGEYLDNDEEQLPMGPSLDHELAKHIGQDTRYSSLQVGVFTYPGTGTKGAVSWVGPRQAAPAQDVPHMVWEQLFANIASDPMQAEILREQNKSVLDGAIKQAESLHVRLNPADRQRLDQYLTSFRGVEQNLAKLSGLACTKPAEPELCGNSPEACKSYYQIEDMPRLVQIQYDLLAMALACDLTRVVTFQMSVEGNNLVFPWLGNNGGWHDLSHLASSEGPPDAGWIDWAQQYLKASVWNMEQVALLTQRLKDFGVFDNTVLFYSITMGEANNHNSINIPLMTLGNVNGALRTGRHIRCADPLGGPEGGGGRRVNDLLLTVLHAYGVPATEFGQPTYTRGPISQMLV
jgi:hypothetical protein